MTEKQQQHSRKVQQHKEHSFPTYLILFSILMIALAAISFLNMLEIPKLAYEVILLIGGLWLLKQGFSESFRHERREILKRYI